MNIFKLLHFDSHAVCPATGSNGLDSSFRRKLQNPAKFLQPYIKPGMEVLDLGCGRGFCTFDIANMLDGDGCVTAADLQQEMLDLLQDKVRNNTLKNIIRLHKCESNDLCLQGKTFDFIILFYMFHEMPNPEAVLQNLKSLLKKDGKILIVEPKIHVPAADFKATKALILQSGFSIIEEPKIFFSRAVVITHKIEL